MCHHSDQNVVDSRGEAEWVHKYHNTNTESEISQYKRYHNINVQENALFSKR